MAERSLALFDVDGTTYQGILVLDVARAQHAGGVLNQAALDCMNLGLDTYRSGQIRYETFASRLLIDWAAGLMGTSYLQSQEIAGEVLTTHADRLYPYVARIIQRLQSTYDCFFATAQPQFVTAELERRYSVKGSISSVFETREGIFTGVVNRSLANREDKERALKSLLDHYPFPASLAFGDTDGDIAMLDAVEHPFCVNPNPALKTHAARANWIVADDKSIEQIVYSKINQDKDGI